MNINQILTAPIRDRNKCHSVLHTSLWHVSLIPPPLLPGPVLPFISPNLQFSIQPPDVPRRFFLSTLTLSPLSVIWNHLCSPAFSHSCSQFPSSPESALCLQSVVSLAVLGSLVFPRVPGTCSCLFACSLTYLLACMCLCFGPPFFSCYLCDI